MANANIDALYVGSLRIKLTNFFPSNFTFDKWCVTKVAHCTTSGLQILVTLCNDVMTSVMVSCIIIWQHQSAFPRNF